MTTDSATAKSVTLRCQSCLTWNRIDAAKAELGPKCGSCSKPILLDRPILLDDDTFARTISGSALPVLVDFYADWCGPCRIMAPAVDELASQARGRALVAKLDTERAPRTAQAFQVTSIPTVIVFENGKPVQRQAGAMPVSRLAAMLEGKPVSR